MKKLLTLIIVLFSILTNQNFLYSANQSFIASKNFLETQIKNKLSGSGITNQHKIIVKWTQLKDGGAKATINFDNQKIQIKFTKNEIIFASKGHILKVTKNKIYSAYINAPGGDGAPQ